MSATTRQPDLLEPTPFDHQALRVTGWVCEQHGLAFETRKDAEDHERHDKCPAVRAKTLAELQAQMDRTAREQEQTATLLTYAKQGINEATSHHRRVRVADDAARLRREAAARLWAEAAQAAAKAVLDR